MNVTERSRAALLLTNRLVDLQAKPLNASEYWSLLARVPEPEILLEPRSPDELRQAGVLTADEATRICTLLAGATAFAFEQERLEEEGVRILSSFDEGFPQRLISRLRAACPSFLLVAGQIDWLARDGFGVVGSRDAPEAALDVAVGAAQIARDRGVPLVSGLARGVDQAAMDASVALGVPVVAVPAEGLRVAAKEPGVRKRVHAGQLCIASPYAPRARSTSASATGRNKLMYALSDVTLVVCVANNAGGTWEGAREAQRNQYGTVAVWRGNGAGSGNQPLIDLGATPVNDLHDLLTMQPPPAESPAQTSLFSCHERPAHEQ